MLDKEFIIIDLNDEDDLNQYLKTIFKLFEEKEQYIIYVDQFMYDVDQIHKLTKVINEQNDMSVKVEEYIPTKEETMQVQFNRRRYLSNK